MEKALQPLRHKAFLVSFIDKKDAAIRPAPKTKSEPSEAGPIWKGGAAQ